MPGGRAIAWDKAQRATVASAKMAVSTASGGVATPATLAAAGAGWPARQAASAS